MHFCVGIHGGGFVYLDDHGLVFFLLQQPLDNAANAANADFIAAVDHGAICGDGDQDGLFFQLRSGSGLRPANFNAGFFDKDGSDDEKDQENENNVNQWGDIDFIRMRGGVEELAAVFHEGLSCVAGGFSFGGSGGFWSAFSGSGKSHSTWSIQ